MDRIKTYRLLANVILLGLSCSTSEKINNKLSLDVVQASVDAWFDLMPGASPGKFHLTGEIKLANSNTIDINNLNLSAITVYSNTEVIYSFEPYFNPKIKEDEYSLKSGSRNELIFGSKAGLKIDSRLEANNVCDVTLNFEFDEGNFMYQVKYVEIIRTY
ncbi:MAG: hypothetical protein P8X73_13325 [Ignavibacteriaceae bacterium]